MAKMPFFQFYPHDWLYDTRICTDSEARVLIDMLCFMWNAPKRGILTGHPQDMARQLSREWLEFSVILDGLNRKKIVDVTFGNDEVTVISRRMLREENIRESSRNRKRNHDKREEERSSNAKVTGNTSEVRSHKRQQQGAQALVIPEDLLGNLGEINDWLEYKKQKGQSYKAKGLEAFWKQLRGIAPENRRASVDHSMANNWSGLFERRDLAGRRETIVAQVIG